jgi:hypothetical protein
MDKIGQLFAHLKSFIPKDSPAEIILNAIKSDEIDYPAITEIVNQLVYNEKVGNHNFTQLDIDDIVYHHKDYSNLNCHPNNPYFELQDKKQWTYEYLCKIVFIAIKLNNGPLYLHVADVVLHLRRKECIKKNIKTVVSYTFCFLPMIAFLIYNIYLSAKSGGAVTEIDSE